MFRKLMNTGEIDIDGRRCPLRFFEQETMHGSRRYSCEVVLGPADRIILDDDSMAGVEVKVARLAPAMAHSRRLASRRSAA